MDMKPKAIFVKPRRAEDAEKFLRVIRERLEHVTGATWTDGDIVYMLLAEQASKIVSEQEVSNDA